MFHYHVCKSQPCPCLKPNECSPCWLIIFKVSFNVNLTSMPKFSNTFLQVPTPQNPICISVTAHVCNILLDLITIIVFGKEKIHESLDSRIFFNLHGLCSSSYVRNHIFHPHKNNRQNFLVPLTVPITMCLLLLHVLKSGRAGRDN